MRNDQHTLPASTWPLLLSLSLGWGLNWPAMKIALAEVPVWTFRALCVVAGASGMFAIARAGRLRILPPQAHWPRLVLTSVFNVTLWNVLIGYGLMLMPAGRAVILAFTMPLWTVLLSAWLLGEPLTLRRMLGVVLGVGGTLLLMGRELATLHAAPIGALLVIGAAISWAIGTVLMKRLPTALPTTSFTGWQLLLGGAPIVAGAFLLETSVLNAISWPAAAAVVYNMVIAFIYCYWAWYKVVNLAPAGVAALGTLLIPIVGVFSSTVVLGEHPTWQEYGALLLVLASIATVLIPPRLIPRV